MGQGQSMRLCDGLPVPQIHSSSVTTGNGERQGRGLLPTPAPQREEVQAGSCDVSSLWRGSWRNGPHTLSRILHLREVRDWISFKSCSLPSNKLSFLSPLWKL